MSSLLYDFQVVVKINVFNKKKFLIIKNEIIFQQTLNKLNFFFPT